VSYDRRLLRRAIGSPQLVGAAGVQSLQKPRREPASERLADHAMPDGVEMVVHAEERCAAALLRLPERLQRLDMHDSRALECRSEIALETVLIVCQARLNHLRARRDGEHNELGAEPLRFRAGHLNEGLGDSECARRGLPTTLWVGEPETTRRHCEQGIALYEKEQHRSLAFLYGGHDPGVCCRMHLALALWVLGYPSLALERSRAGLALAGELAHVASIVNALQFAMMLHQLVGDSATLRDLVGSAVAISAEHGLRQQLLNGRVFESWIGARQERTPETLERFRHAFGEYRTIGTDLLWVPAFHGLLADAYLRHGAREEGLSTIAEALANSDAAGSHLWTPELYRLRGELLLASGSAAEENAEADFLEAIRRAREQGARSWELRTATSLSRLWLRRGKREDARRLLGEIHSWFIEGFDTADMRTANALINELSGASP